MAGGNALNVTAAVGIAAPMQQAAQALHLNFISLSRWCTDGASLKFDTES